MAPIGHYGHLVRVVVLFGAAVLVFVLLQGFFVPNDFGVYGHYRAGALEDNQNLPLSYAGRAACVECHVDVPEATVGGAHADVRCEACHGPLAVHAEDPAVDPGRPDAGILCARCHQSLAARPAGFPQVDVGEHMGGEDCLMCHTAHNPGLE